MAKTFVLLTGLGLSRSQGPPVVLESAHELCESNSSAVFVSVSNCAGDQCDVAYLASTALPKLPEATVHLLKETTDSCRTFDGTILLGQALSLDPANALYSYSREIRRSVEVFVDMINDRGGLRVGRRRYAVHYQVVNDNSLFTQVTNATLHASREQLGANFLLSPFGSSMTRYAAMQADADGKIMMANSAATPSVVALSNLTFGTLPPSHKNIRAATRAVVAAAELCDEAAGSAAEIAAYHAANPHCASEQRAARCPAGDGSCVQSLLAGFLFEDATFTSVMCGASPGILDTFGVSYATDASGMPLMASVPSRGTASAAEYVQTLVTALETLRAAGVTYVVGCTYFGSAVALIDALHQMDYSPLAVSITAAQSSAEYAVAVHEQGWWQGEYVLEPVVWHSSDNTTRGAFTNLTGQEFASLFEARHGSSVGYIGASAFAGCVALGHAIESAGTLETQAVAAVLRATSLREFYHVGSGGRMSFDDGGQADAEMIVTQMRPGAASEEVVYRAAHAWNASSDDAARGDDDAVHVLFPMPTWGYRRCVRMSAQRPNNSDASLACSGHGVCQLDGSCVCADERRGQQCEQLPYEHPTQIWVAIFAPIFALLGAAAMFAVHLRRRHGHLVFRDEATKDVPNTAMDPAHRYQLFLSHVWSTGQDQAAVITRRLETLLPGADVFLDIEDLDDIGNLEEYVESSAVVCFFLSKGYFLSRNCLREVRAAVAMAKPLILVYESDPAKGGATLAELRAECPADLRDAVFGTDDDEGKERIPPPPIIPWLRIESFQLQSLKMIAEHMLAQLPKYAKLASGPRLSFEGDVNTLDWQLPRAEAAGDRERATAARILGSGSASRSPSLERSGSASAMSKSNNEQQARLIFASPHNPGAAAVARRIAAAALPGCLRVPEDAELETIDAELSGVAELCGQQPRPSMARPAVASARQASSRRQQSVSQNLHRDVKSLLRQSGHVPTRVPLRHNHTNRPLWRPGSPCASTAVALPPPSATAPAMVKAEAKALGRGETSGCATDASPTALAGSAVASPSKVTFEGEDSPSPSPSPPPSPPAPPPSNPRASKASKAHQLMGAPNMMREPSYFLLLLNNQTFIGEQGDRLAAELRYVLAESKKAMSDSRMSIVMVHERDVDAGGCEFDRFIVCTPKDLVQSGLYKPIATSLYPGAHADVSHAEILRSMGLQPVKRRKAAAGAKMRTATRTTDTAAADADTSGWDA